ncbi:MAG: phosphoribosylformylglycinamidine synthase [Myxococcales bacterium]|nr:phosphoribosylformylglycinamidine synthase [Myxococcales bacterium]
MAHRIEIRLKSSIKDAIGVKVAGKIRNDLGLEVAAVRVIDVYTLDKRLTAPVLKKIAQNVFTDPIIQEYTINAPAAAAYDWDWLVEVGFRPGVTDNVGRTAREAIALATGLPFKNQENVYTSRQYLVSGKLDAAQIEQIARDLLANELIQRWTILPAKKFNKKRGLPAFVPKVVIESEPEVKTVNLAVGDERLTRISRSRTLALTLEEMKVIQGYYQDAEVRKLRRKYGLGAQPTDVELEALAQTWSEHCKHKIFNAKIIYKDGQKQETIQSLFDTYIKGTTERVRKAKGNKDICLSVFKDNAGVVKFNDRFSLVMKVETHNSPSALDPYGGALTGIVGVNRDPFGTGAGAKLIFNTDVFCFASPFFKKPLGPRLLHPKRVLEGVREGVEHGGNKSGIPTINGSVVFDDRYAGKPLVFCGTAGILPTKVCDRPGEFKKAEVGDLIVMSGGRIGKDGIHGATFSSEGLSEHSPATAVQIGDPITQKRMTDFLLKARDRCLYRAITDDGAGGLSSSVGEMARDTNGCEIELAKAPLKYAGLHPWEILLSEAQERMTLAVPPDRLDEFLALSAKMSVESTVLGRFTDSGIFHVTYDGKTVAALEMSFLHDGLPPMKLDAVWRSLRYPEPRPPLPREMGQVILRMLMRLNVCSKEYWVRQYDHEVQGGSVVKPLIGLQNDGPSDAAVIRPDLASLEGVVAAHGICPKFSDIDTYAMAACAVDEAVRNAVAVGADIDQLAGLDNFCWPDPVESDNTPDGKYKLAQLVRACKGVFDVATAYGIPLISGKDSMKNDYQIGKHKISVPPTLLFTVVGRINDVRKSVTMDAKNPGDLVYLLGYTRDEMGASEYFHELGLIGNKAPRLEPEYTIEMYRRLRDAMRANIVRSCHDLSDGGLAIALAETAFAGGYGISAYLSRVPYEGMERDDYVLFSESPGRLLVTVRPEHKTAFEERMIDSMYAEIGLVTKDPVLEIVGINGRVLCRIPVAELKRAWKSTLNF